MKTKTYNRGDVFYANLDGIGSEQKGVRPVVIVSNNLNNKNANTVTILPITSKLTKHMIPTHYTVNVDFLSKTSIILAEHIRTIDKSRIERYIGSFDESHMNNINKIINVQLGL